MKYFGYAECAECKDQNGPWILENQRFLCEDCYDKMKKKAVTRNITEKGAYNGTVQRTNKTERRP